MESSGPVKSGKGKFGAAENGGMPWMLLWCCWLSLMRGYGHGKVGKQSHRRLFSMNPCLCRLCALTHTKEGTKASCGETEPRVGTIPAPSLLQHGGKGGKKGLKKGIPQKDWKGIRGGVSAEEKLEYIRYQQKLGSILLVGAAVVGDSPEIPQWLIPKYWVVLALWVDSPHGFFPSPLPLKGSSC